MIVHADCRHFRGDVPCLPHKEDGVHCERCPHYDRVLSRVLVVKLDAPGDVLRTTSILGALKEKYPGSHITWVTRKEAAPFFENNGLVDRVLEYSAKTLVLLGAEEFDLVINPDAATDGALAAEVAGAKEKAGFGYDKRGYVYPFNERAERWFNMGLFDDLKKTNTLTYQRLILDMVGLDAEALTPAGYETVLRLSDDERLFADDWARSVRLGSGGGVGKGPVIGLNTGAGGRWPLKKWTLKGYSKLIEMVGSGLPGARVVLYGGPEERERNKRLAAEHGGLVLDTGTENTLREFSSLVGLCDIMVTGDTMAMHVAIALGKKVVVLFGPTSHAEIELYGRGVKVYADMVCLCCYARECELKPNCMELIKPEAVFGAIKEML